MGSFELSDDKVDGHRQRQDTGVSKISETQVSVEELWDERK